jgi:hypothetical protein
VNANLTMKLNLTRALHPKGAYRSPFVLTLTTYLAAISAEAALSKKDDVDIKGGWKVGDPSVFPELETLETLHKKFPRVPYAALTKTFSHIESTTKRLEKTAFLTSFLLLVIQRSAKGDFDSLLQAVYLCINRVSEHFIIMLETSHSMTVEPRLHWR